MSSRDGFIPCYNARPVNTGCGIPPPQSRGTTGNTGASGSTGASGATGRTGASGFQGDTGASGASGMSGQQGQTGASGARGPDGLPGNTGQQGDTGNTGASGKTGASGQTGDTGHQGDTGASGVTGGTGTSGQTGASGDTGARGDTGASGSTGGTGASGNTGQTGQTGGTGNTGASGATGNTGGTGNTGASGQTGDTGSTGNTGGTGRQGDTGSTGNTGASGHTGSTGADAILATSTILYVDSVYGNNSTAIVNRVDRPWSTLESALSTASTLAPSLNPLIYARNGNFTPTTSLMAPNSNPIRWFFQLGATVTRAEGIFITDIPTNTQVWGRGTFITSTGPVIGITNEPATTLYFEALSVTAAASNAVAISAAAISSVTVQVELDIVNASGTDPLSTDATNATVRLGVSSLNNAFVTARNITNQLAGSAVYCTADSNWRLKANYLQTLQGYSAALNSGGLNYIDAINVLSSINNPDIANNASTELGTVCVTGGTLNLSTTDIMTNGSTTHNTRSICVSDGTANITVKRALALMSTSLELSIISILYVVSGILNLTADTIASQLGILYQTGGVVTINNRTTTASLLPLPTPPDAVISQASCYVNAGTCTYITSQGFTRNTQTSSTQASFAIYNGSNVTLNIQRLQGQVYVSSATLFATWSTWTAVNAYALHANQSSNITLNGGEMTTSRTEDNVDGAIYVQLNELGVGTPTLNLQGTVSRLVSTVACISLLCTVNDVAGTLNANLVARSVNGTQANVVVLSSTATINAVLNLATTILNGADTAINIDFTNGLVTFNGNLLSLPGISSGVVCVNGMVKFNIKRIEMTNPGNGAVAIRYNSLPQGSSFNIGSVYIVGGHRVVSNITNEPLSTVDVNIGSINALYANAGVPVALFELASGTVDHVSRLNLTVEFITCIAHNVFSNTSSNVNYLNMKTKLIKTQNTVIVHGGTNATGQLNFDIDELQLTTGVGGILNMLFWGVSAITPVYLKGVKHTLTGDSTVYIASGVSGTPNFRGDIKYITVGNALINFAGPDVIPRVALPFFHLTVVQAQKTSVNFTSLISFIAYSNVDSLYLSGQYKATRNNVISFVLVNNPSPTINDAVLLCDGTIGSTAINNVNAPVRWLGYNTTNAATAHANTQGGLPVIVNDPAVLYNF